MNLSVEGKIRNYIFAAVLGVSFIGLFMAWAIGGEQDKDYRDNYHRYQQAIKLVDQQKYSEAQLILASLNADSQTSYQVLYLQAICAEKGGDFTAAAGFMHKVLETRPALLQDQTYLYRYGTILYHLGEYERAELYLQESLKYHADAETTKEANKYLIEIAYKSGQGR